VTQVTQVNQVTQVTGVNQVARPHVLPAGGAPHGDPFSLTVTPELAGWSFSGLRVLELPAGGGQAIDTGDDEMLVLPLSGGCTVTCAKRRFQLEGRDSVFSSVTDFAYLPPYNHAEVVSEAGGRFALPSARAAGAARPDRAAGPLPPRYGPADGVPVELRGAGRSSRQVNNFCAPEVFEAARLIAVEVLTPAGNWSSYPPHKHDEQRDGEVVLEEIYYFEVALGPGGPGFAYQRVYSSGPDRRIDVCAEVRSGDVVLIPYGYHGPSMAAPGYDLYYLNVMAGPGERAWCFCDDPAHAWVRSTWKDQPVDERLPLTTPGRRRRP
jgi:5-deoxy-glucuronate isomerase